MSKKIEQLVVLIKKIWVWYLAWVRRYIPEPTVAPLIGLDIGTHACKMIAVKPKAGTYEVVAWAVEPVRNNDSVSAVKAVLAVSPAPEVSPATALSGKGTLIRYVEMPRLSKEELQKAFTYEMDKYLPFPPDQIYTDCHILDNHFKNQKMLVMLAAAKKELVDQRVRHCQEWGISPDVITLNPLAAVNAFMRFNKEELASVDAGAPRGVALLDMGEQVSNLTIIVGECPKFTRDLFWGGTDLAESIAKGLEISLLEAEALKLNPGDREAAVMEFADASIANLITELRLSFDYFVTENNITIAKLFLTGGVSMLKGVTGIFSNSLDVRVEVWDPFSRFEIAPNVSRDEFRRVSGQLGVALGLAVYQ